MIYYCPVCRKKGRVFIGAYGPEHTATCPMDDCRRPMEKYADDLVYDLPEPIVPYMWFCSRGHAVYARVTECPYCEASREFFKDIIFGEVLSDKQVEGLFDHFPRRPEMAHKFKLGDRLQEKITGFEGIAIGRCEYLWGCIQYNVKAEKLSKDDKMVDFWFDEDRLKRVATVAQVEKEKEPIVPTRTGGPQSDAPPSIN